VSQRARIGILIAFAGIILAGFGIFFLSRVVQQSITPPPAPTPLPPVTEQVVVAARDLALGDLLRVEDLRLVAYPVEIIPRNAIRNLENVVGRFTKVPLVFGEMVLDHHLADPTNISGDLAFIIGNETVLMAFPAGDLMSSLNVLRRGDIVDLLVTSTEEVRVVDETGRQLTDEEGENLFESRTVTFSAMQRIEITAMIVDVIQSQQGGQATGQVIDGVAQPAPTPVPSQIVVRAYLLALSPQDALVVKHLLDTGAIVDLVLRSPTSSQVFELDPVLQEYITDKYQLEVLR
jgi:pilus assembly protein CpaB